MSTTATHPESQVLRLLAAMAEGDGRNDYRAVCDAFDRIEALIASGAITRDQVQAIARSLAGGAEEAQATA